MGLTKEILGFYDKELKIAHKMLHASLCILLILILIQNPIPRAFAEDAAVIQDPDFPTGTMDTGDTINLRVWIKNTGTSTRSFWVEVCFLRPGGNPDIEDDWYRVTPVESSSIKSNKKTSVRLSYALPPTAAPGAYGVAVEVWEGYDASSGSMIEPIYAVEYGWESFTVTGPPDAPIIIYPDGDTVDETIVSFQWGSVSEATSYILEVEDSDGGVFYSQDVSQATTQSLNGFEYGDYIWHVKAINSVGESQWSEDGNLHIRLVPSTPTPSSPIGDTLTSSTVTFSWGIASYATSYILEVQTPDSVVVYSQDVGDTLSTSVEGLSSGDYEWRAKASNSVGEGAWSGYSDFYVRLPPSPAITSLVASTDIVDLGDTVNIDVDVKNEGYQADEMWVSVLFPDLEDVTSIIGCESGEFNGVPVLIDMGTKIDSGYLSATTKAQYPMIMVENTPWGTGETRRFTVTVRPEESGSFTVYAKTGAKLYEAYSYYPDSGTQDHQGEYVIIEAVEVVEPASPPVACTGGPYTGSEGEAVLFDASGSSDPDDDIIQYEWDLDGDGVYEHQSTESTFSFTWEDDHVGEITLRVTDSLGLSSTDSCTVTVVNVAAIVDAGLNIETEFLEVSFMAQLEDPGADTHMIVWNYGDGSQSTGTLTPVHEYADYGVYTVSVTVTDDDGGESSDTLEVTITEPEIILPPEEEPSSPPIADLGGPYTGSEGEPILVDASGSSDPDDDIIQYEWDLDGDGVYEHQSTESQLSHTWEDDYHGAITLQVTDSLGLSSTDSCTVTVSNVAPSVEAGSNIKTESLVVSLTAHLEDPGADTFTIIWDYGDGGQSTGTLTSIHEYDEYGMYTVTVTVTDDDGDESSDALKVHITEPKKQQETSPDPTPPSAHSGGPYIGSEGEPILLDASGSSDPDDDITQYEWDLDGDDVYEHLSTESQISHTWIDDHQGEATLRVTDSTGLSSTDSCTITINNVAPTVDAGPNIDTESLEVSFTAQLEDPGADTYTILWNHGDGAQSTGTLTPVHKYGEYGIYSVSVTVSDDDGGETSDILEVTITKPESTEVPEEEPSSPPIADLGGPYTGSEGEPILLDASGTTDLDDDIIQYEWELDGDGIYDEITTSYSVTHTWSDDYIGDIWLRATDSQGNQAEAYTYVQVLNVIPSVEAGEDIIVNLGEEVQFEGTVSDPGQDTHNILWDFGDGETADIINPSHVYYLTGVFTVTLNVMDDDMGQSTDAMTVTVLAPSTLELDIIPSSELSTPINIKGILNSNGAPLKNGKIITEYSASRGKTWSEIKTKKTNPKGEFDSTWTPQTTGTYLIRARYEAAKTDYKNNASIQTTLAVTEGVVDYVFSVTSNSIITDLEYNSSKSVLQFTFSGEPDTYSHNRIMIAKVIVTDIEGLAIKVDGVEVEYNYTSDDTQWIIEFEHSHSTHDVIITLAQTENQQPVAQTEPSYEGKRNAPINFGASESYDSDGQIVEYLWDFGDGENLTGVDVKHKYIENGEYVGALTVTDNLGATDNVTFSVKVGSIETENVSDNVGSDETESGPIIAYYEYQPVILQTGQDLLDMSYSTGATELENLDSQKAAELISQVPEEEASLYLRQMNSEPRNQLITKLSPSNASEIMEHMDPNEGVEILVALEDETTLSILEEMDSTVISNLLVESVNQGETEKFSYLMNKLDETIVAESLLELDPVSGARIIESMSRDDLNSAAIRVETIVKIKLKEIDPERAENITLRISETMVNADTESLVDIFVEIANLPETPSTVAALFEMMPYTKVREVVELWMSKARYEELAKVFSYLPTRKLSEIYLGTSAMNRATLYHYLDTDTKSATPQTSFFEITNLTVSQSTVYPSQPVTIRARVLNVGAEASTYRLKLLLDQTIVVEEMLYIESGNSETLSWMVNRSIPKTYFINLGLLKERFVVEKETGHLISSLMVSTCVTEPDIPVTVHVSLSNKGGIQENFNADLMLDGEYISTVSETLRGGDKFNSSFIVSVKEEGMHKVSLGDKTCFFLVETMNEQSLWELVQKIFTDIKSMLVNRLGPFFIGLRMESVYPLGSETHLLP